MISIPAEFNVGANTVVNNAGTFEVNGANLFVNGEFNGALTVSGASVIEGTFADGITVKAGAELAGTLIADLEVAGNFTLNAAGFAGALNGAGKIVTIGADATDIIIAENSTATLALNTGVYAADEFSFGNIAITGTAKDTVITVDDNAFGGNTVSGVAINVTNVEDGLISIFTDLANIKEVNGIAVKFFNGTYFYTYDVVDDNGTADDDSDDTVETITNILTNTKEGIKVSKNEAGSDDEEGSVEINTLVVRGDSTDTADLAVDMGGGTTQLTVVNGNANDKVQFYIGEIGKSELGGTTHVVTGNYTEVIVKNDVDAAGNIVVGAYSDFTVGGTIQGQNLNEGAGG